MTSRRFWIWTGLATFAGLVLRLIWGVWVARQPAGLVDPARYLVYAENIADGQGMVEFTGHVTAYYPPGYPVFLGVVTWASQPFTDAPWLAAALVQAFIGAVTCVLGALVARRLAGDRAGVAAAVVLAIYPNLVYHSGVLLGETLYNALFLGFLALLLRRPLAQTPGPRLALACGLLLGLAVMVRPISLAVVPVVGICWWLANRDVRTVLRATVVLMVGVVACIAPWTVRNVLRMDALVVLSTNTGDNLCIGHGPQADGGFTFSDGCALGDPLAGPAGEVDSDRQKTRFALKQIRENPGREVWLTWRRFYLMWVHAGDHDGVLVAQSYRVDPWMSPNTEERLIRVADFAYWAVLAAGLSGSVVLVVRRRPEGLLLVGCAVMTAAVPLAFFGNSRFKVPVIPLLIIAGATLLAHRKDRAPEAEAEPG